MRVILLTLLLSGCTTLSGIRTSSGICDGLRTAIDLHANALVRNADRTPDEVILSGTTVIKGFDGGCND